jgi:hypothetical protein
VVFNLPMQVDLIIASVGACRLNCGGICQWLRALGGDRPELAGLGLSGTPAGRGSQLGDRQPSLSLPFAADLVHVPRGVDERAELRHDEGAPREVEKETRLLDARFRQQPTQLVALHSGFDRLAWAGA